jgi:RNA polymerase sigma-70 factor (ECF subfamily)
MECAVANQRAVDRSEEERSWSALVVQVAEGNEPALTRLYDVTNRIVYGLALRILGDSSTAEDVTLEVYLQVWRIARTYDPGRGTVSSWLVTLTRSRAIDLLRSRQARGATLEQSLEDVPAPLNLRSDPERLSIEAAQAHMIRNCLEELPVDQRQAIELAYFSGLSHTEIAIRTGLPLGTVKTKIRLGMMRLRELLAPHAEAL